MGLPLTDGAGPDGSLFDLRAPACRPSRDVGEIFAVDFLAIRWNQTLRDVFFAVIWPTSAS
jgi:hypothetical protein